MWLLQLSVSLAAAIVIEATTHAVAAEYLKDNLTYDCHSGSVSYETYTTGQAESGSVQTLGAWKVTDEYARSQFNWNLIKNTQSYTMSNNIKSY